MLRSIKKDKKEENEIVDEAYCAEARTPEGREATEAEQYLTDCEALAASDERDSLKFEREKIEQLADDACMPESVNERATKLLGQI